MYEKTLNERSYRLFLRTYSVDANPSLVCNYTNLRDAAAIEAAVAAILAADQIATDLKF